MCALKCAQQIKYDFLAERALLEIQEVAHETGRKKSFI